MDFVRVRLDIDIPLCDLFQSEGLNHCWFVLNPEHYYQEEQMRENVYMADFARDIARTLRLESSCPHGVILSMDGCILPRWETTRLLKDKDLIRVTRREIAYGADIHFSDEDSSPEEPQSSLDNPERAGEKPASLVNRQKKKNELCLETPRGKVISKKRKASK